MALIYQKTIGISIALTILVGCSFSIGSTARAETNTSQSAQIQSLLKMIEQLQAQLAQMHGNTNIGQCVQLSRSLYLGLSDNETGGEVTKLQRFLGIIPTGFFGPVTEQKLKEWQAKKGIVSTGDPDTTGYGMVGQKTRALIAQSCAVQYTPKPVADSLDAKIDFTTSFIDYAYMIGDDAGDFQNQIFATNVSSSIVGVKIEVPNQPVWLNTSYSKNLIDIAPGKPLGIGVSVNPLGLSAGTYKTEIKITGDFVGSPMKIPVTLKVSNSNSSAEESLSITDLEDVRSWTIGESQTFRWSTKNISRSKKGYIELVDGSGLSSRIANISNTGSFKWRVGEIVSGTKIKPGNYSVKIIVDDIGDIAGPITVVQKSVLPISIDSDFTMTGESNGFKKYVLLLSGGHSENPVESWVLNFTCPSNVSEVIAKVAGNVCGGEDYQVGQSGDAGDVEIPLDVKYTDTNMANLQIHIKAVGIDSSTMDEIDYTIAVHKG